MLINQPVIGVNFFRSLATREHFVQLVIVGDNFSRIQNSINLRCGKRKLHPGPRTFIQDFSGGLSN